MCARHGGRVTALTVTVLSPVTGHSFEVRAFCSIAHGRAAYNINRPDRALHAHWQQRQARRLRDSAPTSTRNVLPAALNRVTTTGESGPLCLPVVAHFATSGQDAPTRMWHALPCELRLVARPAAAHVHGRLPALHGRLPVLNTKATGSNPASDRLAKPTPSVQTQPKTAGRSAIIWHHPPPGLSADKRTKT
jgi:hypothetical protein